MPTKGKAGNGQAGFKSTRNPGKANPKPSVPDSGNPAAQYKQQGPANSWPKDMKPDSGKPTANQ